jgi:hypothetical protein
MEDSMKNRWATAAALLLSATLAVSCSKKKEKADDEKPKVEEKAGKKDKPARPAPAKDKRAEPRVKIIGTGADPSKGADALRKGTTGMTLDDAAARKTGAARPRPLPRPSTGKGRKVLLRLNLQKGKSYKLSFTTEQKITQSIMGRRQRIEQSMGFGFTFQVLAVDRKGTAETKVIYHYVRYKMHGARGMKIDYDSANPPTGKLPVMARPYAALKGQSFTMKITTMGKVIDVKGVDAIVTHMVTSLGIPPGPRRATVEMAIRKQFGNQPVKEMMENMMAIYPKKKVGVGAVWNKTVVLKTGFPSIITTSYSLKQLKKDVAVLEVDSTVKPNPAVSSTTMGAMTMKYSLRGTQKGTMHMVLKTGLTARADIRQNLSGSVTMSGGRLGRGLTMPMKIVSVIKFRPTK